MLALQAGRALLLGSRGLAASSQTPVWTSRTIVSLGKTGLPPPTEERQSIAIPLPLFLLGGGQSRSLAFGRKVSIPQVKKRPGKRVFGASSRKNDDGDEDDDLFDEQSVERELREMKEEAARPPAAEKQAPVSTNANAAQNQRAESDDDDDDDDDYIDEEGEEGNEEEREGDDEDEDEEDEEPEFTNDDVQRWNLESDAEEARRARSRSRARSSESQDEALHPIQRAVVEGKLKELRRLIGSEGPGALVMLTKEMYSLMHLAAYSGEGKICEFLHHLSSEMLVPAGMAPLLRMQDANGWMPIHAAAICGQADMVERMFEWDPSLRHQVDRYKRNLLHLACGAGHLALAVSLYERDPKLAAEADQWGYTPLFLAVESGSLDMVKFLAGGDGGGDREGARRVRVSAHDGTTPALFAAQMGMRYGLQHLLNAFPELIDDRNERMQNAAHIACAEGHTKIVGDLYRRAPQLYHEKDADGLEPILLAKAHKHEETWKYLIRCGLNASISFPEFIEKRALDEERLAIDELLTNLEGEDHSAAPAPPSPASLTKGGGGGGRGGVTPAFPRKK